MISMLNEMLDFDPTDLEMAALHFAAGAHAGIGQVRKYTKEPYIVHPIAVANILAHIPGTRQEVIAAAFLHDVVEDTSVTNETIRQLFGDEVANLVAEVTDVSKPEDGNRRFRKELDRKHLAGASAEGQSIKLADLIDNTKSIVTNDPHFSRVYLKEKTLLLEVLVKGHPKLYEMAKQNVL